jgi:hypothetical protein
VQLRTTVRCFNANSSLEMLILQRWKMTKEVKRVSSCSSALKHHRRFVVF